MDRRIASFEILIQETGKRRNLNRALKHHDPAWEQGNDPEDLR